MKGDWKRFFSHKYVHHFFFWCVVYLYFLSAYWGKEDLPLLTQIALVELLIQISVAYVLIHLLIPRLLNRNKKLLFALSIFVIVVLTHAIFSLYLNYSVSASPDFDSYAGFLERTFYYYGYVSSFVSYFSPAGVLIAFGYYQRQKQVAELLEQKKANELKALKNQLNPHFLFNTLNNLYTLALKKSDKTPEVIAKLSGILDYILYRCQEDFVSLQEEITLLRNYIHLEKVRYSDRVEVTLEKEVTAGTQIAPLLLLTFLENAFKHGVKQELNTARIDISIKSDDKVIDFSIKNTKPQVHDEPESQERKSIGLDNIKNQLDLLYGRDYELNLKEEANEFNVHLRIKRNEV